MGLKISGIAILVCFFLALGVFAFYRKDLPKIKDLSGDKIGGSITYYDRTGTTVLWQDYDGVKRIPVAGDQITDYMRQATVAIEDKNFYKHGAFDVQGIARAGVTDLTGGSRQGGSTITQQLVKINQQWTNEQTYTRKVKELILAVELEREYSKADILNGYLNIAPYGGVEYGVESAARDYFGTTAKNLTLAQSAILAGIPKAPNTLSPFSDPKWNSAATDSTFDEDALIGRQHYILDKMVEQNMITKQQAEDAKKVDVLAQVKPLSSKYAGIKSPFFVLSAKRQLEQKYSEAIVNRGGWNVITTMDVKLQQTAEDLVAKNLPNVLAAKADNEAMVAEDVQTGQIVSLVGGVDYNADNTWGKNNFASGIQLPPGSTFKPYDYATMIDNNTNVGAGSVLYDTKGAIPGYPNTCDHNPNVVGAAECPSGTFPAAYDYDNRFPGPITLRYALGGSRNVPAMKAMLSAVPNDNSNGKVTSINKVISTATAMMDNPYVKGNTYNCYNDEELTVKSQCYTSAAIGDGAYLHLDDHVNGLATLARLGTAIPKTYILKITDINNKVVDDFQQPKGKQVLKPDSAYIVNDMASDPNASYLPTAYKYQAQKNGWKFAVKTGTTNSGYDGLMASWSTKYAVVSWVGYHTRHVTLKGSMETLTQPLTRGWMEAAHADLKPVAWQKPSGVKTAAAFTVRNKVSTLGEIVPSPSQDLFPSNYNPKATASTSQTTDKISGKIATSCTPELAKQSLSNSNVATWNVDLWNGGTTSATNTSSSSSSKATDDVHNCSDTPPTITVTAPSTCDATSGGCTITATVSAGTHPFFDAQYADYPGAVTFTINGQTVKTQNVTDSPSTVSFTYVPTTSGGQSLTATVTDSVLYKATDSANFTAVAQDDSAAKLQFDSAKIKNGGVVFKWSGGSGTVTVSYLGNTLCSNPASQGTCTTTFSVPKNQTVKIEDTSSPSQSDTETVDN